MKIRATHPAIRMALASALAVAGQLPAFAQSEPESKPLTLTIRPSRQAADDPRVRQERLLKRLEQSDYWVRSICIQCGDAWKHQIYAPFNPLDALGRKNDDEVQAE
jgi:hypothetical protein